MRVLVFEQFYSGHYFTYIEHLLPRLSDLASDVVVAITKPAIKSEHFKETLGKHRALRNVQFEGCVPPADGSLPARERFALLLNLRDAISHTKPDYVLVPSADGPTLAMGILGHAGITLLPKGIPGEATLHYGYGPTAVTVRHFLKETAYRVAYSGCSWTHLNFVNFLFFEHALARGWRWAERIRLVPDPVPRASRFSKTEARKLLNVPSEGRYVGFLGLLDPRKAVPELLAAFRAAKLGESDRLLLAGRMDPAFRALIADDYNDLLKNDRLIVIDRHLTETELIQGYGALDLVCVANRPPGLSSLMLKGVAAGRPIISHDFGWSSALVRRFDLGKVADVFKTDEFAQTLRNALEASTDYRESEATKRLLAFHEISNFTETMVDNVRIAVGKPQQQALRRWDWVLQALTPEYHKVS